VWKEKDETRKWRQRSQYLGVVTDMEAKTYEKKRSLSKKQEVQILDYGDAYLINSITEQLPVLDMLKTVFGDFFNTLMALVFHRITGGEAMRHAEDWYYGNFVNKLFHLCNSFRSKKRRFSLQNTKNVMICNEKQKRVLNMSKTMEIIVRIKDENGQVIVTNMSERSVPYIEEIDTKGFRAAFHDLETATLESRKEVCESTISEYLEVMSKKKR
jgi:hypothetical protein